MSSTAADILSRFSYITLKDGVDSLLTIKDANTDEVKFKAKTDSDISMGGAGGDIGKILEENIKKLIDQYQQLQTF